MRKEKSQSQFLTSVEREEKKEEEKKNRIFFS
jgi:hypothetical protein